LGGFGSAQQVSQDFPDFIKDGHSVKDILGKNILQFGFVLVEMMKNCRDSEDFVEVPHELFLLPVHFTKCCWFAFVRSAKTTLHYVPLYALI